MRYTAQMRAHRHRFVDPSQHPARAGQARARATALAFGLAFGLAPAAAAASGSASGTGSVAAAGSAPAVKREVVQLVTLDFPPLEFLSDAGQVDGAAVLVVKEVLAGLGYDAEIQLLPWARSLSLVKEGRADAIFTAYKNAEREVYLDYSREVLIPQVVSFYVRAGSKLTYDGGFAALRGKTIGTVSTISYGAAFDEAKGRLGLKTERVESLDLNIKKLLAGRVDYVISNRYSAQVEIERQKADKDITELLPAVEVTPSYVAFSKKTKLTGLREKFDKGLRKLVKSGRYQTILEQYRVRTQNTL